MRVSELMTEKVLTIGPEAPINDVAKILVGNGISGLPVCDIEGRVLGVISEGDILYKEHDPREGHVGGPLGWIIDGTPNYAVTIAAQIMCERHVNRLPVVRDGLLVGIVTRVLVRAFTRTDAEIERELREEVLERTMWIDPGKVEISVQDGRAALSGRLQIRSDVELLNRLVARVPGVLSVESTVGWDVDDTTRKGRRSLEQPVR